MNWHWRIIPLVPILWVFLAGIGEAQDPSCDSVLLAVGSARDTLQLHQLHRLVRLYWRNEPDSVLYYAEKMLTLAQQLKDLHARADAHNAISYVYERRSDFPTSLSHRWQALVLYESLKDKTGIAWCYHSLGNIYDYQGKYDSALIYHIRALRLREEIGDAQGVCWSLNRIGDCYANQGQHHLALLHRQQALAQAEPLNLQDAICSALTGVAMSYHALGHFGNAKQLAKRALVLAEQLGDKRYTDLTLTTLGECERASGNYDEALRYFRKGLQLREEMQVQNYIAESLEHIGYVLFLQEKYDEAARTARQAFTLASQIQAPNEAKAAAKLLSEIYRKKGDYKTALAYYEQFSGLKDSLLSLQAQKHIAQLQLSLETERKDREIERLQKEAETNATLQCLLLLLSALSLSVLALITWGYWQKVRQNRRLAELNAQLREAREKSECARRAAEDANAFKTELLSIAAHDLQNPLQSIAGFALLLREKASLNPDIDATADVIIRSAQRMLRIITDLLKTTALESGKVELEKSLIDVGTLLQNVVEVNRLSALQKQQRIDLALEPNLIAEIDADRMREVFENLISNAIKYSPVGTTIWIEAQRRHNTAQGEPELAPKVAHLSPALESALPMLSLPSPTILITVRDEGQGLTADDMKKLFGKFQRLSARPTGGEDSTGLGLSIVKNIVDIHGGRVWATSAGKDKGSSFFVELPAALATSAAS